MGAEAPAGISGRCPRAEIRRVPERSGDPGGADARRRRAPQRAHPLMRKRGAQEATTQMRPHGRRSSGRHLRSLPASCDMRSRAVLAALATFAALWLTAIAATPARADEGWVITSFHSDIHIEQDASLRIAEDVRVDFGSLQKHGIFRTIPLRYRYDDTRDRYYEMTVESVTDGEKGVPYTISSASDTEVIKIGDPARLVSGPQRYVITYSIRGAMNRFADHDELFWNVDGDLWPVPKQSVTATVIFPDGSFQKAACFEGPQGSREACTSGRGATTGPSGRPAASNPARRCRWSRRSTKAL